MDCGEPPSVKNAISIYNSTRFGNRVIYNCINDKYKLVGHNTNTICMVNARWNESTPKCIGLFKFKFKFNLN